MTDTMEHISEVMMTPDATPIVVKVCIKCETEKPLDDFHKAKNRKDGHGSSCKTCFNAYWSARYVVKREDIRKKVHIYREANKEMLNARAKERREANIDKVREKQRQSHAKNKEVRNARIREARKLNPERFRTVDKASKDRHRESVRQRYKAWREANKDVLAAKSQAYRDANKERNAAKTRAWREANPEKAAAANKAWREKHAPKIKAKRIQQWTALRGVGVEVMAHVAKLDDYDRMLYAQKLLLLAALKPEYRSIQYMREVDHFLTDYHPDEEAYLRDTLGPVQYA